MEWAGGQEPEALGASLQGTHPRYAAGRDQDSAGAPQAARRLASFS